MVGPVTVTGDDGAYLFLALSPESYTVRVSAAGFESESTSTRLFEGENTVVDFALNVAEGQTTYTLTLLVEGGGMTDPPAGEHVYAEDRLVTIEGIAFDGWQFEHWKGDTGSSDSVESVMMDRDKVVSAVFVVDAGEGEGEGPGLTCMGASSDQRERLVSHGAAAGDMGLLILVLGAMLFHRRRKGLR